MISLEKISKKYQTEIIRDFSYEFKNRGLTVILGSSGSGKSTLLNMISGVDNDYTGEIKIDGVNLKLLSAKDQASFRLNQIGYVFQDFKLFNLLNVNDNVMFNLDAISSLSSATKNEMINKALNYVHLEKKKKSLINKLSGGEKQRVAIARAIITEPKYLLCDEPTGNLDDVTANDIFQTLKEYSENHLVIVVSHDQEKAYKYADTIIKIKDGVINDVIELHLVDEDKPTRIKLIKKSWPALSFSLCCRSGLSKIKAKKWRSVFVNLISSFSLLSLGLGLIIGTSLREQIVSSFSNIIDKNQILVSKKSNDPNPYSSYIASSETTVRELQNSYKDYCYGMGVTYLNNFNTMFTTYDRVYLRYLEDFKVPLPAFHSAYFANFVWPEEKIINNFYPSFNGELALNEIAIGLTYSEMVALCESLDLQRSFEALGAFLANRPIMLSLETANKDWGDYSDKQVFHLRTVYNSLVPEVYHTNHYFNEYLFEELMRFPVTDDISATDLAPFTLKKVYTLHTAEAPTELIEEVMYDERFDDILLERSENFLNDVCVTTDSCLKNVVLVFTLDKNAVDISDILYFKKVSNAIKCYYPSSAGGYQMHESGMLAGFISNLGFSFDESKIVAVGDYFSKQIEGDMQDFPGVAIGNITRFNNNGVIFSSDLSQIKKGNAPDDYNEIVISTGLANYLGFVGNPLGESLYYCMYSSTLNTVIINQFRVVGLVENEKNCLYHYSLFTVSFFRDKLAISAFNLVPTSIVLTLNDNVNLDLILGDLSNSFKEYVFTSPLVEIAQTVDEVMSYVKTVAFVFIAVTLIITMLLLALIAYLNTIESKHEIKLLKHLGHPQPSIMQYMLSHALVSAIITTILAIIELLILQIFLSGFLSNYIGGTTTLSVSIWPFAVILFTGMILPTLIAGVISYLSMKKMSKN